MKGATLFSGIGGVDCGMVQAGIEMVAAVELDPKNIEFSEAMQRSHCLNFPKSRFFLRRVEDMDWSNLLGVQVLHASLVCSNFSPLASTRKVSENSVDLGMAASVAIAAKLLLPTYFSVEQAPAYAKSASWRIISDALTNSGYVLNEKIVDMADYGVPQNRRRFFALCSRKKKWRFPERSRVVSWKEAIAGLSLPVEDGLSQTQRRDYSSLGAECLIQRVSASSRLLTRGAHQPCWTILRTHFADGKGGHRSRVATQATSDGRFFNLTPRAFARICSFPDWFNLPEKYAGEGLGYAVPPFFMKKCYEMIA